MVERIDVLKPVSVFRARVPSLEFRRFFNPDSLVLNILTVAGGALRRTFSGGFYAHPHAAGIA
jgi:hypothetical protein